MVRFEVVKGRKSRNDYLVKIYSDGEVWSLKHVLTLLKIYFDSERENYPVTEGFRGPSMLLSALLEVAFGRPLERVLKDYGLTKRKSDSEIQIVWRDEEPTDSCLKGEVKHA